MSVADVVVIGGGPAGSAAGIRLARAGLRVVLLERSRFEQRRVGEVLSPQAVPLLHELGVWARFQRDAPVPIRRIVSAWGDPQRRHRDFFCHPLGNGWAVDRRRFDRSLVEAAAESGVTVRVGTTARATEHVAGEWRVDISTDRGTSDAVCARYVVHATGRMRGPRSGARRSLDRLLALSYRLDPRDTDGADHGCVLLEACAEGWWYSVRLPDDSALLVLMTDADLLPRGLRTADDVVLRRLASASLTRGRHEGVRLAAVPKAAVAASSRWSPVDGDCCIAAGDALMSFDPLAGDGIGAALEGGLLAAEAIVSHESGQRDALDAYVAVRRDRFRTYLAEWRACYRQEQRWPASTFWARRHAWADGLPSEEPHEIRTRAQPEA